MEHNKSELDVFIKNLCILVHTELESVGGEFKPKENINEVLQLNSFKGLDYISNATHLALIAKSAAKENVNYKDFLNNELYQKEMQKLENEIRNHIKIEQQMKLYCDALDEKKNHLENTKKDLEKNIKQKIVEKKQEHKKVSKNILIITKELESYKKQHESSKKDISKTKSQLSLKYSNIDKKLEKAENDYETTSKILSEFELEYSKRAKENQELKALLNKYLGSGKENTREEMAYKNKYDNQCIETELLRKQIRDIELSTQKRRLSRSITQSIAKGSLIQSHKIIKPASSLERIKSGVLEKMQQKNNKETVNSQRRLPLSFTSRK